MPLDSILLAVGGFFASIGVATAAVLLRQLVRVARSRFRRRSR